MIPGAVHRSPEMFLTAEENPGKSQLGDRLMKGLCDQSSPKMASLTFNEVNTSARETEGKKESTERLLFNNNFRSLFIILSN